MSAAKNDDQTQVMGKVLSGDAATANIVVLGNSSAREALLADDDFNQLLAQQNSTRLKMMNLATSGQSPIESLLIAEEISPREGQVFILVNSQVGLGNPRPFQAIERGGFLLSPEKLITKYSNRNIFPAHWREPFNRFVYEVRATRHTYYLRIKHQLKYWLGEKLYGRPQPSYQTHWYSENSALAATVKEQAISISKDDFKKNAVTNLHFTRNTIAVLADYLRQRKCRFIVALSPEAKGEFRQLFPNESHMHEEMLQGLQSTSHIELLDLSDKVTLQPADFHDLTHLNRSGRIKWSTALATWLLKQNLASAK